MPPRILITGSQSGLGRYLCNELGGIGFDRTDSIYDPKFKKEAWDAIIHCAWSSGREVTSTSVLPYLEDTVFLTQALTSFPHKRFVFISSVDVYPPSGTPHREDEILPIEKIRSFYGVSKLIAERIVAANGRAPIILRLVSLLGPTMRANNLIKVLEGKPCSVSLSAESVLNYISYSDILLFVRYALEKGLEGIFNLASSIPITFKEVVKIAGSEGKVTFGTYQYKVGLIDTSRARAYFPELPGSSAEVLRLFIDQWRTQKRKF